MAMVNVRRYLSRITPLVTVGYKDLLQMVTRFLHDSCYKRLQFHERVPVSYLRSVLPPHRSPMHNGESEPARSWPASPPCAKGEGRSYSSAARRRTRPPPRRTSTTATRAFARAPLPPWTTLGSQASESTAGLDFR